MKLTTIWTLRGMSLRERLNRTGEAAVRSAAHRLPRRLAYWSLIDTGVRHIRSAETVPEVTFTDVLARAGAEAYGDELVDPAPLECPAALNVAGEHFPCDLRADHPGLAHSSRDAQAIWTDDPEVLHGAWRSAEAVGR